MAPRVMKTTLKPRMKLTEFNIILRNSCDSCALSSSTPAPEIKDTYPGTRGKTQGERNEIKPATNAAMGSGRVAIESYATCTEARRERIIGLRPFVDWTSAEQKTRISRWVSRESLKAW